MIRSILSLALLVGWVGCRKAEPTLTPGPIVSKLTDAQIKRLEHVHAVLGEMDPTPFAKVLEDFSRDEHPENEIVIWEEIANAYAAFSSSADRSPAARQEAYSLLLLRSMSPPEEVLKQPLKTLTREEAVAVLAGYRARPQPIKVKER